MKVTYRGVGFEHGDQVFIIPPLPICAITTEPLEPHIEAAANPPENANVWKFIEEHYLPVIGAALRRNYPQITDAEIRDMVTPDLALPMLRAALGRDDVSNKIKDSEEFTVTTTTKE